MIADKRTEQPLPPFPTEIFLVVFLLLSRARSFPSGTADPST
jgi:hypothetical protein